MRSMFRNARFAVFPVVVGLLCARPSTQDLPPPTVTPGVQPPQGMTVGAFTVDGNRNVYYVGQSSDPDFPTTPGAHSDRCGVDGECGQTFFGRRYADVVLVKMGTDGALKLSTFVGGNGQLSPSLIALGPDGSVYIAGEFREDRYIGPQRLPFVNPTVPGCGQFDIFVARLDPSNFSLIYWTCIQGRVQQAPITIFDLAVDHTGSAIVGGYVNNREFPLYSALIPVYRGYPGYIKKLLPNGDVAFSTIFGGSRNDQIWSLAVDRQGDIYVAGTAQSADLPVSRPFQASLNGVTDAFLAKIDKEGRILLFSTYFGGSYTDVIWGVATDNNGDVWVVGDTHSIDFPTTEDALRPVTLCGRNQDCANRNPSAFAARFDSTGRLRYSTLLGPEQVNPVGPGGARLDDVLVGPNNEVHLLGSFTDGMTLVRPLTTQPCGFSCGMLMTLGPRGDIRFASRVPSGRSMASFSAGARGRWTLGPDGEFYLLRQTPGFTTEMIVIAISPPENKRLARW